MISRRQISARRLYGQICTTVALSVAGLLASSPSSAADAEAGRVKAQMCSVCHGTLGIAILPEAPNLAGQPATYIGIQLRHYRDGQRKHEVMSLMAKPLTDTEIDNLAAWFHSIKIEATAPGKGN
jgi:cytochrome c553